MSRKIDNPITDNLDYPHVCTNILDNGWWAAQKDPQHQVDIPTCCKPEERQYR